jgi:hypothetical protein
MAKITLLIDNALLMKGQKYAELLGISLNELIIDLLEKEVTQSSKNWLQELFEYADQRAGNSRGEKRKREDLYER